MASKQDDIRAWERRVAFIDAERVAKEEERKKAL